MFRSIYIILLFYLHISLCRTENIVLIIADDLDLVLDGMTPMNNTLNLIGSKGATFVNHFVASPICCPNRASILTGRYQHNHLTVNNSISGGCSSIKWQNKQEPNTFAAYLKNEMNYVTFYAGKYLNKYGSKSVGGIKHIPPGWDWWAGLVGNSKYYDYTLSINGTRKRYGDKPEDYLTDVINDIAMEFLNQYNSNNNPFLMVLSPPAPHAPFTPAIRHIDKYKDIKAKRTPNFNTFTQTDKHWLVRRGPSPLPLKILPKLDEIYRRRWESLLAVDELVKNVYNMLEQKDLLNDTYIIFTSDNGYHIGQFSMPMDKRQLYETDIRIPLLISGPGIPHSTITAPISSVDIFPTILQIAGLEYPSDGTSFLKKKLSNDRTVLIEYKGEKSNHKPNSGCPSDNDLNLAFCSQEYACKCEDVGNNTYSCIRRVSPLHDNIFCIFEDNEGYIEAYDLKKDNYQMNNIGYSMKRYHRYKFRKRLKNMVSCQNNECIFTNLGNTYY
ncbi:N-acetylglucosamine-6-sulfatase-like [Polistes fuscatus]|uniref:N-acetylglucosamine-6-sulfatase-like n=1 Tax=Polistes fuscatus TaxID=30207 RepID=UPI001CA8747E|nr:N-acetylglucosamine-6-sulfatase-like [Polistes fuscatus]